MEEVRKYPWTSRRKRLCLPNKQDDLTKVQDGRMQKVSQKGQVVHFG